jgi:DnaJ-class molecular chaperone
MADYYEILGVSRQASADEIRKAYFRLARERHPDRFTDLAERKHAEAAFTDLTTAFNTLSSDRKRAEYDAAQSRPQLKDPADLARQAHAQALAAEKAKDYHQAIQLLRTAVHHRPDEARYHGDLGRNLARNPSWAREAVQELEAAARLAPRNASYQAELATAYLAQGLKIRARKAAEAALKLAPEDAAVQKIAAATGGGGEASEPAPKAEPGRLSGLLRRKS